MPKRENIGDALEIVSLKLPVTPKRSRLFSLEPIGIGTPQTESLTSYLNRLACEHYLTPKKLIMRELAPHIIGQDLDVSRMKKQVSSIFANSDAKPALNGMKTMTQNLTQTLEVLTQRKDLKFLSFLSWREVINSRGLFRQYRVWCPQCFEEWQREQKVIYEPLLWSLRDVEYCPQHRCQLVDKCPHCSSSLPVIANFLQLGYCSQCKLWLGIETGQAEVNFNVATINDYQIKCLSELIAIAPKLGYPPTLKEINQKLHMILFAYKQAVSQDLNYFITLGKIIEQLRIAVEQNQNLPLHLVKLIIPVCENTKITLSQLFLESLQDLSKILFKNFQINYQYFSNSPNFHN